MQSTWYRPPEENGPRDLGQEKRGKGRGRGRGRGTGRGRGKARQTQEPSGYDAPTSYNMHAMGQLPPHAQHSYYYNPNSMGDIPPHWQHPHHAQHPPRGYFNQDPYPGMLGYQRHPIRHAKQPGHPPHGHYENADRMDYFRQLNHTGPTHPAYPVYGVRGTFPPPSGHHHPAFSYPTYAGYANQTPTPNRVHQQMSNKRTSQRSQKPQAGRGSAVQTEVSKDLVIPSQTPQVQKDGTICTELQIYHPSTTEVVKKANVAATLNVKSKAQKTLAETAAFLNQKLVLQQTKASESNNLIHARHDKYKTVSETPALHNNADISATVTFDAPQAHQMQVTESITRRDKTSTNLALLLLSQEKVKDLSSRPTYVTDHHLATSALAADFTKYSELSVSLAVEPPPAHQASITQTEQFLKHPDLYTPPTAHRAPASQRLNGMNPPTPPPAHQASTTHSNNHVYPNYTNNLQTICQKPTVKPASTQAIAKANTSKRKSKTKPIADDVLSATHAVYQPHQMVGETQIVYQPSTETFASEQVLYQPQIDMFTKEQIVYQPRKNMLAKTQVVYQPRSDFIATAEAVYQSDRVAARQTVIQPQAGRMKTAETVYNPHEVLAARQASYQRAESVYRAQENNFAERHTNYQHSADAHARARTQNYAAMNRTAPILHNILSNEDEQEESQLSERNIAALQQFLQENYNNVIPSNAITSNQTLRQTRKRKISPPQTPDWAVHPQHYAIQPTHELVPSRSSGSSRDQSAAADLQSIIALNWTLQCLSSNPQVNFIDFLNNLTSNNNNMGENVKYDNNKL